MAKLCATTGPWLMRTSLMRFLLLAGNVSPKSLFCIINPFLYVPGKNQFLLLGAEHPFVRKGTEMKEIC